MHCALAMSGSFGVPGRSRSSANVSVVTTLKIPKGLKISQVKAGTGKVAEVGKVALKASNHPPN